MSKNFTYSPLLSQLMTIKKKRITNTAPHIVPRNRIAKINARYQQQRRHIDHNSFVANPLRKIGMKIGIWIRNHLNSSLCL